MSILGTLLVYLSIQKRFHHEPKLDGSNAVTAKSECSAELVPIYVQEKGQAIRNDGNTNQNIQ